MHSDLDLLDDPFFLTRPISLLKSRDWATDDTLDGYGSFIYHQTADGWDSILDAEFACYYELRPRHMLLLETCDRTGGSVADIEARLRNIPHMVERPSEPAESPLAFAVASGSTFVTDDVEITVVENDLGFLLLFTPACT